MRPRPARPTCRTGSPLNTKTLAEHDVHFPSRSPIIDPTLFQFRAALDLLGQDWGGTPGHAEGAWDALVARRARRQTGTVIISHEILAPARPADVDGLKHDLRGAEIHVVYGARDLARQVPAAWQESIKQGRKWSYRKFLERMQDGSVVVQPGLRPAQRARHLERRAAARAGPRGHRAAPRGPERRGELLWHRFCEAFGIDPAWAPLDSERANRSLGMAETQLLRRLNRGVERTARRQGQYDDLIRDLLVEDQLGGRESGPVRLPPDAVRLGRRAGRALDRVGRADRRRTSSATSPTCGRCRRPTGPSGSTPTGSRPRSSSTPRSTRWPR